MGKEELESLALNRARALIVKLVSFRNRGINVLTMKMVRKELDEAANAFLNLEKNTLVEKVESSLIDRKVTSAGE